MLKINNTNIILKKIALILLLPIIFIISTAILNVIFKIGQYTGTLLNKMYDNIVCQG